MEMHTVAIAAGLDASGEARIALENAVHDYGPQVLGNPRLLCNLFKDLMPDSPREASLLVTATEAGAVAMVDQRVATTSLPSHRLSSEVGPATGPPSHRAMGGRSVSRRPDRARSSGVISPAEMIASLPIREVTVFGDRAEVVRRGELRVDEGVQEVVVEDLPASLVEGTVRAGARSTVSVRLLSTDVRTVFLEESQNPEVLRLTVQLEELEAETAARARRRDAINLRRSFLASLSNNGGRAVARALAHGEADVTAATAIAGLLSAQSGELDGQEAQLDAQEREAAKQRDALGRRIAAIGEAGATRRRQVAVGLEMTGPGDVELEVRYNVLRCRWAPIYDIRLTSADGPTDLRLTYLAEVTQSTGEDWDGVSLLLSTARTTGGTRVPELEPWLLQPYQPPRPMMSAAGAPMGAPAPECRRTELWSAATSCCGRRWQSHCGRRRCRARRWRARPSRQMARR